MYKFQTKGLSSYFLYFLLTLTLTWCVCPVLDIYDNEKVKSPRGSSIGASTCG